MSVVLAECPPDYQRINLEVQCPAYLIENSEELQAIFHSGAKPVSYFIQIVKTKEDCSFEGCFIGMKTQRSVPEEDTLKFQEQELLLVGPTVDPGKAIGASGKATTAAASNDTASMSISFASEDVTKQEPYNEMVVSSSQLPPLNDNVDNNNMAVEQYSSVSESSHSKQSDSGSFTTSEAQSEREDIQRRESLRSAVSREEDNRRRHALYHVVHKDGKCPLYDNADLCRQNYDDGSAWLFKHYFNGWKVNDKKCEECIVDHLASDLCDSSCPMWEFCLTNKIYGALKYAKKGFLVHSKLRKDMVGKVSLDYNDYQQEKYVIGRGGFGIVYQLNKDQAVKEETKRPLIFLDSGVFKLVAKLNNSINDHVIPLLEYVVGGPSSEDPNKRVFLFVMPLMNKGGLNNHFKEYKCILEYMMKFSDQKECIFKNYMVLFLHVFKGLQYLHSRSIVHGDIKDTNILVQQTCSCVSPLQCVCPGGSGVTYVLGDMDLFCVQGKTLTGKYLKWAKEKFTEPAGTRGLKPTELYFMGMQGEKCASNKTDVWAGSLTMMKILAGDDAIKSAIKYLTKFFDSISLNSSDHVFKIAEARDIAQQLQKDVGIFDLSMERPCDTEYLNTETKNICDKFKKMSQLLASGKLLKQGRWMFSYTYPEKLPLPLIIGAVHGANVLYEGCLNKIPSVFNTPLWETMNNVLKIITACVKFLPDDRPDALQVITDLEKLQKCC